MKLYWIAVIVSSISVFGGLGLLLEEGFLLLELSLGWGVSFLGSLITQLSHKVFPPDKFNDFMVNYVGWVVIKFLFLGTACIVVFRTSYIKNSPFIFSLFVAYIIFMIYDVAVLRRNFNQSQRAR